MFGDDGGWLFGWFWWLIVIYFYEIDRTHRIRNICICIFWRFKRIGIEFRQREIYLRERVGSLKFKSLFFAFVVVDVCCCFFFL